MLKINDKIYTFTPQTDRIIQISGHMLRQSVMGSDMSYNDILEDKPLNDIYTASFEKEIINDRKHYVIFLEAIEEGLAYPQRRAWVDAEYFYQLKKNYMQKVVNY